MTFKEFVNTNEGWLSQLFSKRDSGASAPRFLGGGDPKHPAVSYGNNQRRATIAKKVARMRRETETEKQNLLNRISGNE